MAACLNCTVEGRVSPESLRRWTERLCNVLVSSTGRSNFRDFLESRGLEEGLSLLNFWELCDKYLTLQAKIAEEKPVHVRKRKTKSPEGKASSSKSSQKQETVDPQSILELADMEINFNVAEMDELSSAIQSGDTKQIGLAVTKAKERAVDLLEDCYTAFCSYLLKNMQL